MYTLAFDLARFTSDEEVLRLMRVCRGEDVYDDASQFDLLELAHHPEHCECSPCQQGQANHVDGKPIEGGGFYIVSEAHFDTPPLPTWQDVWDGIYEYQDYTEYDRLVDEAIARADLDDEGGTWVDALEVIEGLWTYVPKGEVSVLRSEIDWKHRRSEDEMAMSKAMELLAKHRGSAYRRPKGSGHAKKQRLKRASARDIRTLRTHHESRRLMGLHAMYMPFTIEADRFMPKYSTDQQWAHANELSLRLAKFYHPNQVEMMADEYFEKYDLPSLIRLAGEVHTQIEALRLDLDKLAGGYYTGGLNAITLNELKRVRGELVQEAQAAYEADVLEAMHDPRVNRRAA